MKFLLIATVFIGIILMVVPHVIYVAARLLSLVFNFNVRYKPFGVAAALLFAMWLAMVCYGHYVGRFKNVQTDIELRYPTLPKAFDGYRVVQISDIHLDGWAGHEDKIEKLVDDVNALDADLVVFTGDLISIDESELTPFIHILRRLKAKDGVYSILGNHDYMAYSRNLTARQREEHLQRLITMEMRDMGWHLLMNDNDIIRRGNDSIAILGSENQSLRIHSVIKRGNLKKTMAGTDGMFRILLTHDPSHWRGEVADKTDIPLTLSGHTHGGQVSFFGLFYFSTLLYKEHAGLYSTHNQKLYVNIGVGGTMPMRVGAPSEITVITLRR